MNRPILLIAAALAFGFTTFAASARSAESAGTQPLQALMITGGCCHDYETQKRILSEGISERANVEWTIIHEGGDSTDHVISVYHDPDWAEGYDIVVHNECFAEVRDEQIVRNVTNAHKAGVPAVVIHCTMHTFRDAPNVEEWHRFLGVSSNHHQAHMPYKVENLKPDHPIMKALPATWKTPKGELYHIEKVQPTASPLAQAWSEGEQTDEVCIWTNQYGEGRVFGTTIGHHNQTMQQDAYLDLITRGLLWACDKLDDDGKPKPGYEPEQGQ